MTKNKKTLLVPNLQKTKARRKKNFACAAEQLTDKLDLIM